MATHVINWKHWLACPQCGAKAGTPCTALTGPQRSMSTKHYARPRVRPVGKRTAGQKKYSRVVVDVMKHEHIGIKELAKLSGETYTYTYKYVHDIDRPMTAAKAEFYLKRMGYDLVVTARKRTK